MIDILERVARSELHRTVSADSSEHFVKRLAHIDSEGHPERRLLEDPRHAYVLETSNRFGRVEGALRQSIGLVLQIHVIPPGEWLEKVALKPETFAQQTLDHFTLVLHSTLDRCLLLANLVMSLGIHDRLATFKTVQKEIRAKDLRVAQAYVNLYDAVGPLSDPRHFFAHRGEHRAVGLFSQVVRVKQIVAAWEMPTAGVQFNETDAWAELRGQMTNDVKSVASRALAACDTLTSHYKERLEVLGGVDLPTEAERLRAREATRYFEGGERPSFMNVSSREHR